MKLRNLLRRVLLRMLTHLDAPSNVQGTIPSKTSHLNQNCFPSEFYLDENSKFEIAGTPSNLNFPRWMQITHCEDKRHSIVLVAGESLKPKEVFEFEKDTRLYVRFSAALPTISADGLVCSINFLESDQLHSTSQICDLPVTGGQQSPYWRIIDLDISFLAGRKGHLILSCLAGPSGDPSGDWLAVSDLCIAREDKLPALKARSFHDLRSRNEIAHFSSVYRHSMYSSVQNQRAEIAAGNSRPVRKLSPIQYSAEDSNTAKLSDIVPLSGESPYGYASRLLASCIPQPPPNFAERLKSMTSKGGVVKVLSLCSGAARIEASYAAQVGLNVEWSLLDINADLLGLASKQFPPEIKLDLIEANANELEHSGEKWDVILCVSALHHIVELEKLIKFCHDSLTENGEFWSIGEYVGRNGNRLWPDARAEATKLFRQLPEQYRLNRHANQLDSELPDNDFSVGCFEGIRSEDIEPVLDRWFHPADVYRRNCFLWRLINLAYSDNFDLEKVDDRGWIIRMVNAEADHFRTGGRGTELFGVYSPRLFYQSTHSVNE